MASIPREALCRDIKHCSVCGEVGHRSTHHDPNWINPRKGETRCCSVCGEPGHNSVIHRTDEGLKQCNRCKQVLPVGDFHLRQRTPRRTLNTVAYRSTYCKECDRLNSAARYRSGFHYRLSHRMMSVRQRCRDRGQLCTIDTAFLEALYERQGGRCFYSNRLLSLETGDDSVSVDRRDPLGDYTPENVVLTTWQVNNMKKNIPERDFIALCRAIAERDTMRCGLIP